MGKRRNAINLEELERKLSNKINDALYKMKKELHEFKLELIKSIREEKRE